MASLGHVLWGRRTVRDQWSARLPEAQERVFASLVGELEVAYAMLSITLNEAFTLRRRGALNRARESAGVSADLFERLAAEVQVVLDVVGEESKHFGALPEVTPPQPEFYRGESARRAASWNQLLHRVLFSARARFFHKLHALEDTVRQLTGEFRDAADEIAAGASVDPEKHWSLLDSAHYDLNTSLRETIVLLKSFLHGLPGRQLGAFALGLETRRIAIAPAGRSASAKPRNPARSSR